jgi:3D (Asp-Asp-Asp) domain-containing protein
VIHLKAAFYARALMLIAALIVSATFAQTPTDAPTKTLASIQVNSRILELQGFPFAQPTLKNSLLTKNVETSQPIAMLEKPQAKAVRVAKTVPVKKQITARKAIASNRKTTPIKTNLERNTNRFPSLSVRSTAYNSIPNQTDSSPFHTATGARTRYGIIALSRDLLRRFPYGSKVTLEDVGSWRSGRGYGKYNVMLKNTVFVVEDTMHPRKRGTVDVWLPARRQAMQWGVRRLNMQIVQLGR